jgi:hypothetical protein
VQSSFQWPREMMTRGIARHSVRVSDTCIATERDSWAIYSGMLLRCMPQPLLPHVCAV